ncbi:hypothetical protein EON64_08155, partial [archaeon]
MYVGQAKTALLAFLGAKSVKQVLAEKNPPPAAKTDDPAASTEPSRHAYSLPATARAQPNIVPSTVTLPGKLLRLKAELLNLLFLFPEKALRWPEQGADSEKAVQAAGDAASAQVIASAARYTQSGQVPPASIDLSPENVERMADRAARKAKRRLRRKLATEAFIVAVQKAINAEELCVQLQLLDSLIPT